MWAAFLCIMHWLALTWKPAGVGPECVTLLPFCVSLNACDFVFPLAIPVSFLTSSMEILGRLLTLWWLLIWFQSFYLPHLAYKIQGHDRKLQNKRILLVTLVMSRISLWHKLNPTMTYSAFVQHLRNLLLCCMYRADLLPGDFVRVSKASRNSYSE
jgi:hypothetical protein